MEQRHSENLKCKLPDSLFQGEMHHDTSFHHLLGIFIVLKGGAVVTPQLSSQDGCDIAEHDNTNLSGGRFLSSTPPQGLVVTSDLVIGLTGSGGDSGG